MLSDTEFKVDLNLIDLALQEIPNDKSKIILNYPTGNFFYDLWKIKSEYVGTCWEEILGSLPSNIGEARIIKLEPETCYVSHADIDDRYHLNLQGDHSYLIDIENEKMYQCQCNGQWYDMNAGILHTATNFGNYPRIQLVVRKLLKHNILINPKKIKITTELKNLDMVRFLFDAHISSLLNKLSKNKLISNFFYKDNIVNFYVEESELINIKCVLPKEFNLEVY